MSREQMPSFTKLFHNKPYPAIDPTQPKLSASGKVVLITGAGSGIGAATAVAFAAAKAKAIILCGRRVSALEKTKANVNAQYPDAKVLALQLDKTREEQVRDVFRQSREVCGALDICIDGAGHLGDMHTIRGADLKDFWDSFEVNIKGGMLVAQHFLRNCREVPEGASEDLPVLISMNTLLAHFPATATDNVPASYAASKIGLAKLIEWVAKEERGKVRAYSIQPGVVATDMNEKSIQMSPEPDALRKEIIFDEPELPAQFCVWLASRDAVSMPSGKYFWINWDVEELKERAKELQESDTALVMTMPGWPFPLGRRPT